jgi:hypothetical protein
MIGKPLGKDEVKGQQVAAQRETRHGTENGHIEQRDARRSKKMITQKIAHRDFGELENMLAGLADDGREPSLLLAARDADASLARAQEDAAIEAQDVLSQADEALVLG